MHILEGWFVYPSFTWPAYHKKMNLKMIQKAVAYKNIPQKHTSETYLKNIPQKADIVALRCFNISLHLTSPHCLQVCMSFTPLSTGTVLCKNIRHVWNIWLDTTVYRYVCPSPHCLLYRYVLHPTVYRYVLHPTPLCLSQILKCFIGLTDRYLYCQSSHYVQDKKSKHKQIQRWSRYGIITRLVISLQ